MEQSYAAASSRMGAPIRIERGSTLSKTFSALKWFLALTVVADHFLRAFTINVNGGIVNSLDYSGMTPVTAIVISFFKNYAVPIFFFMSGYLLLTDEEFTLKGYLPLLKKRVTRLFVPFIIWGGIGLGICYLYSILAKYDGAAWADIFPYASGEGEGIDHLFMIRSLLGVRAFPDTNVPLWYMRDLILALCMLPVLHMILRYINWKVAIGIAAAIFLIRFSDHSGWRFEVAGLFFTSGYLMRRHRIEIIPLFKKIFPLTAACYLILGSAYAYSLIYAENEWTLLKNINIVMGVPFYICLFHMLVEKGWIKGSAYLASASFFIYVLHHPLINFIRRAAFGIYIPEYGDAAGTAMIIASYLSLILLLLGLYAVLHKRFPRAVSILSGGR